MNRKLSFRALLFLLLLAMAVILLSKRNSNDGRMLIIENTVQLIKKNLTGVGWGKFKVAYNLQQAQSFKHHSINDKTSLLADNVEFALNEYLQITAEGGILNGIAFIVFNLLTFWLGTWKYRTKPTKILLASIIGLSGFLTACLTFYFLHCWWGLFLYSIFLIGIYGSLIFNESRLNWVLSGLALLLFPLLIIGTITEKKFKAGLRDAVNLSRNGYKYFADSVFNTLAERNPNNAALLIEKGKHLAGYGNPDSALSLLLKAKDIISRSDLYVILGDIYSDKQNKSEAEYYYLTAVYMVPNRFISRKKLSVLYKQTNQIQKEVYWLKSILDLPEKFPSEVTGDIKEYSRKRLRGLGL